jgi:hypothetical protein
MKVCLLPVIFGTHLVDDTCFLFSRYIHPRTCMQCTSLRPAPCSVCGTETIFLTSNISYLLLPTSLIKLKLGLQKVRDN